MPTGTRPLSGSLASAVDPALHAHLDADGHLFVSSGNCSSVLAALGNGLERALADLQASVDRCVLAFYRHLRRQRAEEETLLCERRHVVPEGFRLFTSLNANGELVLLEQGAAARGTRETARTNSSSRLTTSVHHSSGGGSNSGKKDSDPMKEALPPLPDGLPSSLLSPPRAQGQGQGAVRRIPLARRLQEQRDACCQMQAFLHLVLECALTQTDAVSAAVYINAQSPDSTREGPTARPRSHRSLRPGELEGGAVTGSSSSSAPPRFIHCVAQLNGDGKFPGDISYATLSPLTSVVQSGVAVNFRQKSSNPWQAGAGGGAEAGEGTAAAKGKTLHIQNGVIVPIKKLGCVVLADKRLLPAAGRGGASRAAGAVRDFTLYDEHVAWSTAQIVEAFLLRYDREVLLKFPWAPSAGVTQLQPFMLLPPVGGRGGVSGGGGVKGGGGGDEEEGGAVPPLVAASRARRRKEEEEAAASAGGTGGTGALLLEGELEKVVSRVTGRPPDDMGVYAKSLVVVRTADRGLLRAVPPEQLARHPDGADVSESDLFLGASEYIANLESLWQQALEDGNRREMIALNTEREAELRLEKVVELEAKVRRLNARVVQLERADRFAAPSSPQ